MTKTYQICARCVMDTTDRIIQFDSKGNCNHCTRALSLQQLLTKTRGSDVQSFDQIVEQISKKPGREGFHALIGVSGGVDSSFLLHLMSKTNLKLLAVHVDAGWNSLESVKNINQMVSSLNIDLETIVIDWESMKELQLAYLRSGVINQDVPQDHAFFGSLYRLAKQMKIQHVISGSNIATESILPQSWGQNAMDGKQLQYIAKKFGAVNLEGFPVTKVDELYWSAYVQKSYRVVAPLNYIEYSRQAAVATLEKEFGWVDYGGKHKESRFTDFFQEVYLLDRFGIQKKRAHLASLIVNGEMSRERAIDELKNPSLTGIQRENMLDYIATKLEISRSDLSSFIKMPYCDHRNYPNQEYLTKLLSVLARVRNRLRQRSTTRAN